MQLTYLKLGGYKNLNGLEINFQDNENASVIIGNNGSGKSNIIEAISGIFAGLYLHDPKKVFKKSNKFNYAKQPFDYTLHYTVKNNSVKIDYKVATGWKFLVTLGGAAETELSKSDFFKREADLLPSQVIANYSGEENRLFDLYYKAFYDSFKSRFIKTGEFSSITQKLHFVNKYFWQLALLSLIYKQREENEDISNFFADTLGIEEINNITFTFNTAKYKRYPDTDTIKFVRALNPNDEKEVTISFDDLMQRWNWATDKYFFNLLSTAYLPLEYKIITDIRIDYNQTLDSTCFSEGEKKLILLQFILEVLADEESLILLDEPDSHIHISRKEIIKTLINKYTSRDSVLTTHSPTLTHSFGLKHIVSVKRENGGVKVEPEEKSILIDRLTGGVWSYEEQTLFLNSSKHILLFEGKNDTYYLKKAIAALSPAEPRYRNIDFTMIHCGGADNVEPFFKDIIKTMLKPSQLCIAIFDDDKQGRINFDKLTEIIANEHLDNVKCFKYPKTAERVAANATDFILEDYFPVASYKTEMETILAGATSYTQLNALKDPKKIINENYQNFDDAHFQNFSLVLDKIIEIRDEFEE